MGWESRKGGRLYFYKAVRTECGVKKIYMGRKSAGQLAAASVEQRRKDRERATATVRIERDATAEADRLADELHEWASVLSKVWLGLCGLHNHKGTWRLKREQDA